MYAMIAVEPLHWYATDCVGLTGRLRAFVRQKRPQGRNVLQVFGEVYAASLGVYWYVWATQQRLLEACPIDWGTSIGFRLLVVLRFFEQV